MSCSMKTPAAKRKREEPDEIVLSVIKNREDTGILKGDIKFETKLNVTVLNKALKNLLSHNLIKEVMNIKNKSKQKHYMAAEYEPSKEISGGAWYVEGKLDTKLIQTLEHVCCRVTKKATTLDVIYERLNRVSPDLTKQQVSEILTSMVLSNQIIEVKSTGFGEFHSIPIGTICYKADAAAGLDENSYVGEMASIPCGRCPRIKLCTPDGVISPSTCAYYTKWLDESF